MKRTAELVELCKNLYVREQLTYREIAKRVGFDEKTIRNWKNRDGDWDREREAYLDSKRSFHEELYEFMREIIASVRDDLKSGEKIDQSRLSCVARILPLVLKPKDYEEVVKRKKEAEESAEQADLAAVIAAAMEL
jgi:transposase